MRRWYVVQTQIRGEEQAARHLRNQRFDVFLPRYRKEVRHARRRHEALRPLFPGYLFVALDIDLERWRAINGTIGVRRLIASGESPTPVPDGVVEEIEARGDDAGIVALAPRTLRPGQGVRLETGPFAQCQGIFEEMVDERRVVLLLDLLGRQVRTRVDVSALAVAD